MSDNVNSGERKRVKEQPHSMAARAVNKQDSTERTDGKDVEMIFKPALMLENQIDASNPNVTAKAPAPELSAEAHTNYKSTGEGSEDVEMTTESPIPNNIVLESLRTHEPVSKPISSTKPQPTRGFNMSGTADVPNAKRYRQGSRVEVKPTGQPARKIYRGIGLGDGTVPYDKSSYSLPLVSIEQQARDEPDFVGEADYYDLLFDDVQEKMVPSTYLIVYSRRIDDYQRPYGKFETYPPDLSNKIVIESTGAGTPVAGGTRKSAKHNPIWAEGELDFNGISCSLWVRKRYSNDRIQAVCKLWIEPAPAGNDTGSSLVEQTLRSGPRETDQSVSTVRFGLKYCRTTSNESLNGQSQIGFEFIAMDVATWDFNRGEKGTLRVVGVKIPKKKDVASAFLLNQRVSWPADRRYIHLKPSLRPKPTINLRALERKEEGAGSPSSKHKSWAEKAEAAGGSFLKKGEASSYRGDTRMG